MQHLIFPQKRTLGLQSRLLKAHQPPCSAGDRGANCWKTGDWSEQKSCCRKARRGEAALGKRAEGKPGRAEGRLYV